MHPAGPPAGRDGGKLRMKASGGYAAVGGLGLEAVSQPTRRPALAPRSRSLESKDEGGRILFHVERIDSGARMQIQDAELSADDPIRNVVYVLQGEASAFGDYRFPVQQQVQLENDGVHPGAVQNPLHFDVALFGQHVLHASFLLSAAADQALPSQKRERRPPPFISLYRLTSERDADAPFAGISTHDRSHAGEQHLLERMLLQHPILEFESEHFAVAVDDRDKTVLVVVLLVFEPCEQRVQRFAEAARLLFDLDDAFFIDFEQQLDVEHRRHAAGKPAQPSALDDVLEAVEREESACLKRKPADLVLELVEAGAGAGPFGRLGHHQGQAAGKGFGVDDFNPVRQALVLVQPLGDQGGLIGAADVRGHADDQNVAAGFYGLICFQKRVRAWACGPRKLRACPHAGIKACGIRVIRHKLVLERDGKMNDGNGMGCNEVGREIRTAVCDDLNRHGVSAPFNASIIPKPFPSKIVTNITCQKA
ncbi:hypothetical protein BN871_IK_00030 [Paenibacillus sp. P22]|nr:hypothetical protein BN871_IK_00030 [Paenibacillus sp. P22]